MQVIWLFYMHLLQVIIAYSHFVLQNVSGSAFTEGSLTQNFEIKILSLMWQIDF